MPRRKRTFIHRSTAHTYHVVRQLTSDDPRRFVLVSDNPDEADALTGNVRGTDDLSTSYKACDYEYGEFGFPEDGYDYSKHFRTIGGGGGVFMSAATGLPDPDAVTHSKKKTVSTDRKHADDVVFRDNVSDCNEDAQEDADWGDPQASELRKLALDEIARDRQRHSDLDEVLALLDAVERSSSASGAEKSGADTTVNDEFILRDTSKGDAEFSAARQTETESDPENYFESLVNENTTEGETSMKKNKPFEGVKEKYREPRLLDAQFDSFMREFDDDASDDEDVEEFRRIAEEEAQNPSSEEQALAFLAENEKQGYGVPVDLSELLDDMSELKLLDNETSPRERGAQEHELSNLAVEDEETVVLRKEVEGYRLAEFDKGMEGLLSSYTRIPASEVLDANEGLEGAKRALKRQQEEEKSRFERKNDLGVDSDGHDSELDTLFDELYADKDEKWDCQTIISTYTNVDNHPSVIDAPSGRKQRTVRKQSVIQLDPRTQAPSEFVPSLGPSSSARSDVDFGSRPSEKLESVARVKGESKDDKKARKAATKEMARERRAMKSVMKKAFGAENAKQNKHSASLGTAKVAIQF